jgi:hypothetical protein
MTRAAISSLVLALTLGAFAADSTALDSNARVKPRTPSRTEFKYVGEVRASYTIVLTDSASEMMGRTSIQIRYGTPLVIRAYEAEIGTERAPSGRQQGVGRISISVTGRDRGGCEFAFDRSATTRMMLTADAFGAAGSVRLVSKPVRAGYTFVVAAHAVGELPKLTTACNLNEPIYVLSLRELLQVALWFDSSETALAGAWPHASRANGFNPTTVSWPVVPLVYEQVWAAKPTKRGGRYQLPMPAARLASGKPLTITRSPAKEYPVAGAPSVTIRTTGTLTFSFKPRR